MIYEVVYDSTRDKKSAGINHIICVVWQQESAINKS